MSHTVKDLTVPIAEYASVPEDATLFDAVLALEQAQEEFSRRNRAYKHRAVLVLGKDGGVVGKVSQLDVLKGLDPRYDQMGDFKSMNRFGFSSEFVKSMFKNYGLLDRPLDDICRKAMRMMVKNVMSTPSQGEYLDEGASLNEAIHQFVVTQAQSILVTREGRVVGILRLTDVFMAVFEQMKSCEFQPGR